jgi:hypothetical protein
MRPIRAYAATFEAINQYHLTPKWKAKLIGTIGHVNRARPHKTGCGDIGIAKLRITQTPATMKPTSAHNPILRFMVSGLIEPMLRLDDSPGQLVRQFGQLTQSGVGVEKVTDCTTLLRRDEGTGCFFSDF